MAAAGTFIGEVQRGWQRLLGLSWRGKAVVVLILLGVPTVFILCSYVTVPWATQPSTKHVSYSALLDGQPSSVLAPWMEDHPVDFRLLRITESAEADQKRLVIAMDVRTETNHTPHLSCQLGFTDGGENFSVDENGFVVAGDPVEDAEIRHGRLAIDAVFLIPATARPLFLEVKLDGGGCSAIHGCQEGTFVFEP
jgi:hypothetical protein